MAKIEKEVFTPILNTKINFKSQVPSGERSNVKRRMGYDKKIDYGYSETRISMNKGGKTDLGCYLGEKNIRPVMEDRITTEGYETIYFEEIGNPNKQGAIKYKFRPSLFGMVLKISAEAKGNMGVEDLLDLKELENFILTGEMPASKK